MPFKEQSNRRKNSICEEKLLENTAKPKELWQTLKITGAAEQKKFSIEYMFKNQK